jgi:hypothetical protein
MERLMRNWALLVLLTVIGCHAGDGDAPPDLGVAADLTVGGIYDDGGTALDGVYNCRRMGYRDISCSPLFLAYDYQLRIAGLRLDLIGHGGCVAHREGAALACPVQQFDATCRDSDAFYVITPLPAGGLEAAIPVDLNADALCSRQ